MIIDYFFLFFLIVLYFFLAIIYLFNHRNQKKNNDELFKQLFIENPETVSFCLGFDKSKKLYKNVIALENSYKVQYDSRPILLNGQYQNLNLHGHLKDLNNGFEISGFTFTKFICPNGFTGSNCQAPPFCLPTETNKLKPLSNAQFDQLQLYKYKHITKNTLRGNSSTTSGIKNDYWKHNHPKLRIHCLEDQSHYKIEHCASNKKLNNNLECIPYDLCEDNLNGYRHNYQINPTNLPLLPNEYYLCQNNASVLLKCPTNAIFDRKTKTCLISSICKNEQNKQIKINNHLFVECKNEMVTYVKCPNGIREDENNLLICRTINCKPLDYVYEDTFIKYVYAKKLCNENDTEYHIEVNTHETTTLEKEYEWGDKFKFTYTHIPKQIIDANHKVVDLIRLEDILKEQPFVYFRWSDIMFKEHMFNPITNQFICSGTDKFQWDYYNNKSIPDFDQIKYALNSSSPCNTELQSRMHEPFYNMAFTSYPKDKIPILYATQCKQNSLFWPYYNVSSANEKPYRGETLDIIIDTNLDKRQLKLTKWQSETPPLGFLPYSADEHNKPSGDIVFLNLVGYSNFEKDYKFIRSRFWLFNSCEQIHQLVFKNNPSAHEYFFDFPKKISSKDIHKLFKKIEVFILWSLIVKPIELIPNQLSLQLDHVLFPNDVKCEFSFAPMYVTKMQDKQFRIEYLGAWMDVNDEFEFLLP